MKATNQFKVGKFTTDRGNTYEIKEIIEGTHLNYFLEEDILYGVVWYNGRIAHFTEKGINSIIRNS